MDDSFVNLGEEVILTLLWQSGASESATVCFVISLIICYLLFKWGLLRVVCVCACVCARARVCVCVWERERNMYSPSEIILIAACLQTHTSIITVSVCHATLFPFQAWTDAKTKDIINFLYFNFERWNSRLWKGAFHFWHGLWCSANHNALGQLANQSRLCLSEGGTL